MLPFLQRLVTWAYLSFYHVVVAVHVDARPVSLAACITQLTRSAFALKYISCTFIRAECLSNLFVQTFGQERCLL